MEKRAVVSTMYEGKKRVIELVGQDKTSSRETKKTSMQKDGDRKGKFANTLARKSGVRERINCQIVWERLHCSTMVSLKEAATRKREREKDYKE